MINKVFAFLQAMKKRMDRENEEHFPGFIAIAAVLLAIFLATTYNTFG